LTAFWGGNGSKFLARRGSTYPDLSLFQVAEGLRYAFPNAMVEFERRHRGRRAHYTRIAVWPRVRA
jgi:glutathione S-transferase